MKLSMSSFVPQNLWEVPFSSYRGVLTSCRLFSSAMREATLRIALVRQEQSGNSAPMMECLMELLPVSKVALSGSLIPHRNDNGLGFNYI